MLSFRYEEQFCTLVSSNLTAKGNLQNITTNELQTVSVK